MLTLYYFCSPDRVAAQGPYENLSRGQVTLALHSALVKEGLYVKEQDSEEEVLVSKFGDVVTVREMCDVKRETGEVNLRKPFLFVSTSETGPTIPLSSNVNMEAEDNKMTDETGGRTGGFCTACDATEQDMHGQRSRETFYMNLGADSVWDHFNKLASEMGGTENMRVEDIVIPSARGDARVRLGTKHAPLTDQIEFTKVK